MAKSVTYNNNHRAYAMLYGRRKGWLEGYPTVTFASIERTNRRLKHATNMSIHLEGKRHKPTKPYRYRSMFSYAAASSAKGFNTAGSKMHLCMGNRKRWKIPNSATLTLFAKRMQRKK